MKINSILSLTILIYCFGCSSNNSPIDEQSNKESIEIITPEFETVLKDFQVAGSILIFEPKTNTYYSNNFDWARNPCSPASTFKIPNSIIALETGILTDETSIFEWDKKPRKFAKWEKDLTLKEAFEASCVPCYQEVARKIGVSKMREMLDKLNYPGMQFDSTTLDNFWLEGASKITQFEQIDFLKRFYFSELPINARTHTVMKKIMIIIVEKDYTFSGKSGWTFRNDMNVGWLVGYLESLGNVYFFATNIEKEEVNMDTFPQVRIDVTISAFQKLGILSAQK